jgi:hypothetical protein
MKCADCDKEAIHISEGLGLCERCMYKRDLCWDNNEGGFVPKYKRCPSCGGKMAWCSICNVYSRVCCVDYGTCLCS